MRAVAVAALGIVRAAARGRRPAKAQAGVLLRRSASVVRRNSTRGCWEKIEQVVRLIRSKGVGVFFVTQNPRDVPDNVLGQLGNRVQHALRAFTPRDQKAVQSAAETFRAESQDQNRDRPSWNSAWAKRSFPCLDEKGQTANRRARLHRAAAQPAWADHARISGSKSSIRRCSLVTTKRLSIGNRLMKNCRREQGRRPKAPAQRQWRQARDTCTATIVCACGGMGTVTAAFQPTVGPRGGVHDSLATSLAKSAMRAASSQLGRQIARGLFGGILGGSGRRR